MGCQQNWRELRVHIVEPTFLEISALNDMAKIEGLMEIVEADVSEMIFVSTIALGIDEFHRFFYFICFLKKLFRVILLMIH